MIDGASTLLPSTEPELSDVVISMQTSQIKLEEILSN
jgi:hypothetical protein